MTGPIPLTIIYSTQTGNSEQLAENFCEECKNYNFTPEIYNIEDFDDYEDLAEEKFIVFFVSTYGEGEPPEDSESFYKFLKTKKKENDEIFGSENENNVVNYCIFGLGDSTYSKYQKFAEFLDDTMEELGAEKVLDRGEGDDQNDVDYDFEEWKIEFFEMAEEKFNVKKLTQKLKIQPKYKIVYLNEEAHKTEESIKPFPKVIGFPNPKQPCPIKIVKKQQLLEKQIDGNSTISIEFDLKNSNIFYEAGDHLGIYPENENQLIQSYIKRLNITPDILNKKFKLETNNKNQTHHSVFPVKEIDFLTAFKYYFDLTSKPKKVMIKFIANNFTKDEKEKKKLLQLVEHSDESCELFHEYISESGRNFLDVLNDFKSIQIPINYLIEIFPRLKPRFYSIASSSLVDQNRLKIVVGLNYFKTSFNGIRKKGCCSSFLIERTKIGQSVYVYSKSTKNYAISKLHHKFIMISAGTGVAPFLGLIERRRNLLSQKTKNEKIGDVLMFFGCRKSNEDFIEKKMIQQAEKDGVITKLYTAFSREQKDKIYVQDLIVENKEKVWKLIEKGATIFVCGNAQKFDPSIKGALTEVVKFGKNVSTTWKAQQFLDSLIQCNKYKRDIWG